MRPLVHPRKWVRDTYKSHTFGRARVRDIDLAIEQKGRTTTRSEEAPRRIEDTSLKEIYYLFIHHTTINFSHLDQSSLELQSKYNNSSFSST